MNKRNGLDLDQVMHRMDPEDTARPAFRKRAGAWVGSVLIAALGAGTLAAAPSYAAAQAAQAAVAYWESLPTDLPLDVALPQHTVLLDRNGAEFGASTQRTASTWEPRPSPRPSRRHLSPQRTPASTNTPVQT